MADLRVWLGKLFGSEQQTDPDLPLSRPATRAVGPQPFAVDHNDFALTLYGLLAQQPGNLICSPFSIRTALAMTYAGARGETAAQMKEALRFSSPDEQLQIDFGKIIQRLNEAGGGQYEMAVANSLWAQDGATLRPEFLDLVARHYAGGLNLVDFRDNAEAARVAINQWVEDKTRQRIRGLIPPGNLDALMRLVLVNAVYFKGMWMLEFSKKATRDQPFYLEGGGTVPAPLMHQQRTVRYVQRRGFQAVDLVYRGGDLSMLVLLPDEQDGLRKFESSLSESMLRDCVVNMDGQEVKLFLPRFKITWGVVDISDPLTVLGMTLAFNRHRADFSGINGYQPPHEEALSISSVFHKAFVEVNEEGTEAAAATAVAMREYAAAKFSQPPPVPIFRADHPFLFAIRDRISDAILFLGRVADPTRES